MHKAVLQLLPNQLLQEINLELQLQSLQAKTKYSLPSH